MRTGSRRALWVAALAIVVSAGCQSLTKLAETTEPVATMTVSGGAVAEAIGMGLVEGIVSFRDARYRVTFRGMDSSSSSTGEIYSMAYARDLEGTYSGAPSGRVRNERGGRDRVRPTAPGARRKLSDSLRRSHHTEGHRQWLARSGE